MPNLCLGLVSSEDTPEGQGEMPGTCRLVLGKNKLIQVL